VDILQIKTETKQYPVYIGKNILSELNQWLSGMDISRIMVVADRTVHDLYMGILQEFLPGTVECVVFPVPSGEKAKTLKVYEDCMTFAIDKGLDRKSVIIAFGGGACGDLAGFVAATFMRGVKFIGVPTTILAHDSSVGGKVAVNHKLGKNLIGQFYHPEAVIYDTAFLESLPAKEVRSGMAEVIKHALISDDSFYVRLKNNLDSFSDIDQSFLIDCLKQGIATKAEIVSQDERETGVRAFLNFGHTYGHALENLAEYKGVSHGEAVMAGMIFSLFLSKKYTGLQFDLKQFIEWIKDLGYNAAFAGQCSFDEIYSVMSRDKKALNKVPKFVLLKEIGEPVLTEVSREDLKDAHKFVAGI
jgi:3-dehydroquinate synthase